MGSTISLIKREYSNESKKKVFYSKDLIINVEDEEEKNNEYTNFLNENENEKYDLLFEGNNLIKYNGNTMNEDDNAMRTSIQGVFNYCTNQTKLKLLYMIIYEFKKKIEAQLFPTYLVIYYYIKKDGFFVIFADEKLSHFIQAFFNYQKIFKSQCIKLKICYMNAKKLRKKVDQNFFQIDLQNDIQNDYKKNHTTQIFTFVNTNLEYIEVKENYSTLTVAPSTNMALHQYIKRIQDFSYN
jgi:hypothetical protein